MSDDTRHILLIPFLIWLALLALLFSSLGYAYWHDMPAKLAVGLGIAGIKASLIGAIYMQLRKASPLVHVAAACGLAWLSLLFIFSFADFLTR